MEAAKRIMIACIDLLMEHPLLALVPSLGFFALTSYTRRLTVAFAAIAWALYSAYEEAITLHVFCPRGCNIRLDLILIYPILIALSIAGLVVGLRPRRSATRNTVKRRGHTVLPLPWHRLDATYLRRFDFAFLSSCTLGRRPE